MTNQKKMQIAAMNAKDMSIEEISKSANINAADVEAFLATRDAAPAVNREETAPEPKTRTYNRMTPTLLEKMKQLRSEGLTCAKIADQLGFHRKTVEYHLRKAKTEQIEKEPAQAATCTDSEVRNSPIISTSDNTTETSRCQGLSGISGLSCLESALDEWLGLGQEAEIVSIEGDREKAYLRFLHDGQIYEMGFRRCRDV